MSDAVVATFTADEQAHLIGQRREVQYKFNESLFSLEIIKVLGQPSYGDKPEQYLKNMRKNDATFDTDIGAELHRIEMGLRAAKLEQQWRKEGRGQDLHDDEGNAMQEWIAEQLEQGAASEVQLRLPTTRRGSKSAGSILDNKNTEYEETLHTRRTNEAKGPGDRVALNGRMAMVLKNRNGECEIKWDKRAEGEEETARVPGEELVLISKAHPAMMITADSRAINYNTAKWRHKSNAISCLSSLFSHADGTSGPDFLVPAGDSRKAKVERMQKERKSKMMTSKPQQAVKSPRPRRELANVTSKFMQKPPFTPLKTKEIQIKKEAGEPLGLVFDHDTLCLTEVKESTPSAALDAYRGMRITHVSLREDYSPFTTDEGVHSKEQLRKALNKCAASETVALRFEQFTQRRAVEKKKREFREKLISHKDKVAAAPKKQ